VILANGGSVLQALQQVTRTVPIVFVGVNDPVGAGRVDSLARPGGNVTGFSGVEYRTSEKWLELLKDIAPRVTRVAILRNPTTSGGRAELAAMQLVAGSLGVQLVPVEVRNAADIERGVTQFAHGPNDGMIVVGTSVAVVNRTQIIALAASLRLPTVYPMRVFVADGGLAAYGAIRSDDWRRAAGYVDRILKGEKPGDLPVQTPTRYETVLNMKTAKALGLDVPATALVRADEVIE
jgi:putative ABC transport system substrate-binding protein